MGLSFNEAKCVHSLYFSGEPESRVLMANAILELAGQKPICRTVDMARDILRTALHVELNTGHFLIGATLCWGTKVFDARPRSVKLILRARLNHPRLLIFGSGSQGKSYSIIALELLDWERDPEFTTTKLVSTTAGHARAQTFSTMVRLHRDSAVPLSGYIKQGFIGLDKDDKRSSISEVAIEQGENKGAKLQGFHPLPRPYPHPIFGDLTRVHGVFDEAEDIPPGLWKGEANLMLNMDDLMHVRMVAMWNPKRRDSMAAQKAEPVGGWGKLDERLDEYTSKAGYHVVRLDSRRSENVMQRKVIFPGHQTYEGYRKLEDAGGADFDTFGKGVYPSETAAFNIISPMSLDAARGTFIWSRPPQPLATLDMAEEGEDKAMFTGAEYGLAIGFEPEGKKRRMFDIPRWCIQVEQQFPLVKQNTIKMGAEAIRMCRLLRVPPEWFALDCTNSVTLRDWIRLKWGEILGIKWGEAATEMPIFEEEGDTASDLYANVKTEMWFATGAWAEFGYLAFSPHMDTTALFTQLTMMQYRRISKTMKQCEETKEFKKRYGGKSPDEAASCVMTVHLVRSHSTPQQRAAMDPSHREHVEDYMENPQSGEIISIESGSAADKMEFVY